MTACKECEYLPVCRILSILVRLGYVCRQGRKKKEYRIKQTTLDEVPGKGDQS